MAACDCNTSVKLIYSCSGAADVGELADRVTRQLRRDGIAQGSCVAALGADLSGFVQSAKGADVNITIDGCPVACAKKILERSGVTPVAINLADLGCKKGESAYSEQLVSKVTDDVKKILNGDIKVSVTEIKSAGGCGCGCSGNC